MIQNVGCVLLMKTARIKWSIVNVTMAELHGNSVAEEDPRVETSRSQEINYISRHLK